MNKTAAFAGSTRLVGAAGLALVGLSLLAVAPSPSHAQMSIATDEPVRAFMQARTPRGEAGVMPLVDEQIRVTIDAQLATTRLKQVYRNQSGAVVEGRYRLQAGASSRVEGFAYWNGEQKIVGEVFEKQTARAIYDSVTRRRRDPGLLEEEGDGVFSFKIFPIQPNEDKRVEIGYTKWLTRRGNTVEYRAPVNRPNASIVVEIAGLSVGKVRSPTHHIDVDTRRSGGARIRAGRAKGAAKAFVLRYEVRERPWTVSAFVHRDQGQDGYFAVSLAAPDLPDDAVAAKDVTIVLDRSGSMSGEPIAAARNAAVDVIRRLGSNDRINVVAFDDDVDPLWELPKPASAEARQRAIRYVEGIREGGGTDLALALETALNSQASSDRPRVVLFLTDGKSAAETALDAAKADRGDVRVFTVGIGEGVNKSLLSRLAAEKRGRYMFIGDAADIERDVGTLYRQISRPLLVGVSLDVSGAMALRTYPRSLPDLFADDQLVVSGRLRGRGPVSFTIRGVVDGKPFARRAELMVGNQVRRPWVGKLWAQSRVAHLLEEIDLHGDNQELENEVIDLALAYNFVTKYTSFLAIPESELTGAARGMMASARERKAQIMAKHRDAADLGAKNDRKAANVVAGSAPPRGAVSRRPPPPPKPSQPVDAPTAAPEPEPAPATKSTRSYDFSADRAQADSVDDAADYGGEAADEDEDEDEVAVADGRRTRAMEVQRKGSGCGGCAAPGPAGNSAWWLVLAGLLLAIGRRRR